MPSIPIDILQEILGHVPIADLATLCRVSKIFCSCSQNVLYRDIFYRRESVIQTLARSTDLARQVRRFGASKCPELATALRNMSSLRRLNLDNDVSVPDGCTFKLDSLTCSFPCSESLQNFLNSQPSLTDITLYNRYEPFFPFDERCLPNLTRVSARLSWLRILIPGRPVREVRMFSPYHTDFSFFTLSATPIQKLWINFDWLCPVSPLVSTFPSLVHLVVEASGMDWTERVRLCLFI
jgi:F-box-like